VSLLDAVVAPYLPEERYEAASILRAEIRRRIRAGQAAAAACLHQCSVCKIDLPHAAFSLSTGRPPCGLESRCRACRKTARGGPART
jgi:hypothetical protein